MDRRRYTREILQAEADRWVEVLTAKGFMFPDAPITVYTNGRQHDMAAGLPRGFTTRAESYLLTHRPDEYFDEIKRWQRLGVPSHTKSTGLPIVYIRLRFPRAYFGGRRGKRNPLFELLHELMHLVIPHLPNWKAHELTTEIYLRRGRPSMTERLIRKARSRAHLAWMRADSWNLESGWDLRPRRYEGPRRLTHTTRSLLGREARTSFPTRSEAMTKLAKKQVTTKKPAAKMVAKAPTKIPAKKAPAKTPATTPDPKTSDENKNFERNAKLRAWRAAHVDQQKAYMAGWRARRKAAADNAPSPGTSVASTTSDNGSTA